MKDYKKLTKVNVYDKEAAEELAELVIELRTVQKRAAYLEEVLRENSDLQKFLWTTAEGVTLPLHKIEDDHLKNILTHIVHRGGVINKEIKAEARSRGMEIPDENEEVLRYLMSRHHALEGEVIDEDN